MEILQQLFPNFCSKVITLFTVSTKFRRFKLDSQHADPILRPNWLAPNQHSNWLIHSDSDQFKSDLELG